MVPLGLPAPTQGRRLVAGAFPEKVPRAQSCRLRSSVCPTAASALPACLPLSHIDPPLLPSLSRSTSPALGLFHASVWSVHSAAMFVLPGAAALHTPGAPFPQMLSISGPFSDSISVLVCLLCLPNLCAEVFSLFFQSLFPLSGVCACMFACLCVCPSSHLLHVRAHNTHTHTHSPCPSVD